MRPLGEPSASRADIRPGPAARRRAEEDLFVLPRMVRRIERASLATRRLRKLYSLMLSPEAPARRSPHDLERRQAVDVAVQSETASFNGGL